MMTKQSENFTKDFAKWIVNHPWTVIVMTFIVAFAIGQGARHLEFNTNYRIFFSESNPQLEAFEELEQVYSRTDNILFTILPDSGEVFNAETLKLVQEMTTESWQLPYAQRVDSITNFQHTEAFEDDLIVADLVEGNPDDLSTEELTRLKQIAVTEPLLINRLISEDADATGINITINLPRKDMKEVTDTAAAARQLVLNMKAKYPGIEIKPSGMVFMNNAFVESSMKDMTTIVPIMYAVLLIAMVVFLRRMAAVIATLFVIAFSASSAMGFGGLMGFPLTPPSSTVPTIVLTLAIADSIHVIVSMLKAMGQGMTKRDAIVEALRINFQPIFLTSLTTIIGFMSLNFSDAPPFWHLGNMAAFGIGAAFVYSITFLPAVLSLLPINPPKTTEGKLDHMERFANWVIEKRAMLLVTCTICFIAIGAMVVKIETNDQFVQYFDHSIDFRGDTEFMMEHLTGVYLLEYSIPAAKKHGITDPAYLRDLDRFTEWLRTQPEVIHVYSMTDVFKRLNKNMHADDDSWYRLPTTQEMAAQYLLLYEISLPYGLDLNDRVNIDRSATRITVTARDMSTREIRDLKERSENWLNDNTPSYMTSEATSPAVMFSYISERNIDSMVKGNLLSLILISLVIMIALRSLKMGFLSLVPNLTPVFIGYGLWGLFIGEINMAVAIAAAVSLGIIVDDTVHFLSKYLRARREKGLDTTDAVRYAFSTVGTALFVTTLILVFGFLTLAQSGFQINSYLGLLTALVIGSALVADFLLLPPLMMRLAKDKQQLKEAQ